MKKILLTLFCFFNMTFLQAGEQEIKENIKAFFDKCKQGNIVAAEKLMAPPLPNVKAKYIKRKLSSYKAMNFKLEDIKAVKILKDKAVTLYQDEYEDVYAIYSTLNDGKWQVLFTLSRWKNSSYEWTAEEKAEFQELTDWQKKQ